MAVHRELLKSVNAMTAEMLDAINRGDTITARRWAKEIQHHTSDTYIVLAETVSDVATLEALYPRGELIEGVSRRGSVS